MSTLNCGADSFVLVAVSKCFLIMKKDDILCCFPQSLLYGIGAGSGHGEAFRVLHGLFVMISTDYWRSRRHLTSAPDSIADNRFSIGSGEEGLAPRAPFVRPVPADDSPLRFTSVPCRFPDDPCSNIGDGEISDGRLGLRDGREDGLRSGPGGDSCLSRFWCDSLLPNRGNVDPRFDDDFFRSGELL